MVCLIGSFGLLINTKITATQVVSHISYRSNHSEVVIAQNEWTSLAIHDRRSGKIERTSAFNEL